MSSIFGVDPVAGCRFCGVTQYASVGDEMPDVCSICANPRSLVRFMNEIRGMTPEQARVRREEFVSARGANMTPAERAALAGDKEWNDFKRRR